MTRKKKIFLIVAALFIAAVIYFAYDMGSRTTAPWNKKKEVIEKYKVK